MKGRGGRRPWAPTDASSLFKEARKDKENAALGVVDAVVGVGADGNFRCRGTATRSVDDCPPKNDGRAPHRKVGRACVSPRQRDSEGDPISEISNAHNDNTHKQTMNE